MCICMFVSCLSLRYFNLSGILSANTLMWFSGATTAGRASSVTCVCLTLAACTGPVLCPGSALATRTGAASCAIKVRVLNASWFGLVSFEKLRSTWNCPIKWSAVDQNEFKPANIQPRRCQGSEFISWCYMELQHLTLSWFVGCDVSTGCASCDNAWTNTLWILWLWLEWRSDIWSVGQRASWKMVRNEKKLRCAYSSLYLFTSFYVHSLALQGLLGVQQ